MVLDPELRPTRTGAHLKWMTAGKLIEILSALDRDAVVMCNSVANIAVYQERFAAESFVGYIDFASERFVPHESANRS